jgi:hypothetical protein
MFLEKPADACIETDEKGLDHNGGADWSPEEEKSLVFVPALQLHCMPI